MGIFQCHCFTGWVTGGLEELQSVANVSRISVKMLLQVEMRRELEKRFFVCGEDSGGCVETV